VDQPGSPSPPAPRHRHTRDVVRLLGAALALLTLVVLAATGPDTLVGSGAGVVTGADPRTGAGRVLVVLVQLMAAVAAVAAVTVVLRHRRFRLLATLVLAAVLAGLAYAALDQMLGEGTPARLAANLRLASWPADPTVPGPAVFAAAAAVATAIGPWTARPWRRATWVLLFFAAASRVAAGTALPFELLLALATGAVVGSALLLAFGAPDRRIGPQGVADALGAAGVPVVSVVVAPVQGKGSRSFVADVADGRRLFVKVLGREERHADLLYRAYRFLHLRGVDDVRRPATLRQAVEHQALVAVMAERAGVRVPRVERVVECGDGSAMLVMDLVDGRSFDRVPPEYLTDEVLQRLWAEAHALHRAGIAHRSLRSTNVMLDGGGSPWIVDFSFSEVAATPRQIALDVAELLASLAVLVGPERAVAAAVAVVGPRGVAPAVPLLQPLALSAATRTAARAVPPAQGRSGPGRPAGPDAGGGRRRQWCGVDRAGPDRPGAAAHAAADRRRVGGVLLPATPAGPGRRLVAGVPVGAPGVAGPGRPDVGDDLRRSRHLHARERSPTPGAGADRAGPDGVLVRQPGDACGYRRDRPQRPVPGTLGGAGRGRHLRCGPQRPGRWSRPHGAPRALLRVDRKRADGHAPAACG